MRNGEEGDVYEVIFAGFWWAQGWRMGTFMLCRRFTTPKVYKTHLTYTLQNFYDLAA